MYENECAPFYASILIFSFERNRIQKPSAEIRAILVDEVNKSPWSRWGKTGPNARNLESLQ